MSQSAESRPVFTLEDVLRLQRLAASFEFRAHTTRHAEESRDAERMAQQLTVLANKVAQLTSD